MKRIDLMLYLMGIYDNIFPNIQISHAQKRVLCLAQGFLRG